jgi:hypothetical protein
VLDDQSALHSALILSQDRLPDPLEQVLAGKPADDGRLTAEEMLRLFLGRLAWLCPVRTIFCRFPAALCSTNGNYVLEDQR